MNRRQKLIQQQFLNNERGIIKRLNQVYGQALKDVNGEIEKLMKRFDSETGDLPQSAVYQLKYQNMIKDQLEGILNQMQTKQFLNVSDYLNTCYEDGFIGSIFDLHGQGVPLMMPLDQEAMVTAVQLDSKISQGLYTRLGEDVSLLKKRITAEVSRSIATGASFADTAKQLAGKTRIGYNRAIRIARTEGHRIQNQANMNVMGQAKDRGADVVKQWDATLDGKTRESHSQVDGEIRELDEAFSNGLQFPGDPAGGAAEVVNCRCRVLQRARWAVGDSFTKWNNFTKQLETFDSPQDYDEFKKAFFSDGNKRYMNYVQQMEQKYQTRDFVRVLDGMSDSEYKRYSDLLRENPIYNKGERVDSVPETPVVSNVPEADEIATITAKLAELDRQMDETIDFVEMVKISEEQDLLREKIKAIRAKQAEEEKKRIIANTEESVQSTGLFKKVNLEGCDVESAQAILSTVEKVHVAYPDASFKSLRITKENISGFRDATVDSLGQTNGTSIRFNGTRFGNSVQLSEYLAHEKDTDWTTSGTIEGLVAHEFGHAITNCYGIDVMDVAHAVMRANGLDPHKAYGGVGKEAYKAAMHVSRYGDVNLDEWFAECFSSVMSTDNPSDVAKKAVDVFNGLIRKK